MDTYEKQGEYRGFLTLLYLPVSGNQQVRFVSQGHTQSLVWMFSWCFYVNIYSDTKISFLQDLFLEWQLLIQNCLQLLGLYFSHMHCFIFISIVFSLPFYYPVSGWCEIPVLLSQAAFVFDYWKQLCIISHLGYPPSLPAYLWMCWTMQDLAWSPSPAFLLQLPLIVKNDQ